MKRISITIMLLLSILSVNEVMANSPRAISTQELVGVCTDQSSPAPQTYCDIYGQGIYDGYLVTRHPIQAPDFICVAQPAPSRREVMNQFIDWAKVNSKFNTAPAADTLLRFLAVRFPCGSSAASPENAVNKIIR